MFLKIEELGRMAQSIVTEFPDRDFSDMEIVIETTDDALNRFNENLYYKNNPDADKCETVDEVDLTILGVNFKYVKKEKDDQ